MPLNITAPHAERPIRFKDIRRIFLIYFSTCLLLSLVIFVPRHLAQRRSFFLQLEAMQKEEVNIHYTVMTDMFNSITSDLMVLAHQDNLKRFVENGDPADLEAFSTLALSMNQYKNIYYTIRFIDHHDMERIRIQNTDGTVFQVSPKDLQNKSHRYYVQETRKLPPNNIFMSPLDLNKENNVIELPFKPMLRIATPIYNTSGQYRGMVILNYIGKRFLERMQQTTPDRHFTIIPHLINRKGYWFLNDKPETQWGFMFKERSKFTFQNRFPQAWEKAIGHQEKGHVMTSDGLFSFATFYPIQECRTFLKQNAPNTKATLTDKPDPLAWKIIFHTPQKQIQAHLRSQNLRLVFMLVLFIGIGVLASWNRARHMVIRQRHRQLHKNLLTMKDGLFQSTSLLSGSLDLEKMLTQALASTKDLIKARYAAIGLADEDGEIAEFFSVGFSQEVHRAIPRCPPRSGLIRTMLQEKKSLLIEDMNQDHRFQGFPHGHPPMSSFLGTPILYKNQLLGAIYLSDSEHSKGFTIEDLQLMEVFATHIAAEINTKQLYQQIQQTNEVLEEQVEQRTQSLSKANNRLKKEIQSREKVAEALRKSEIRFRSTFEQAAVGIAHVSPEGKPLRVNKRLCHILGYDQSELLQMTVQELTHPNDLRADLDLIQEVLDTKVLQGTMEKRYIHKNGYPVWCNVTISLLCNSDGTPHYFISIVEDITQRKKAEAQLNAARIEAEKANMAKNNFLASISHELRTPLNAVIGFSEVLLDQFFGPLNKQQVEYINDILQSGRHLLTMINDILDLSKVETKQISFSPVPTALEPVMDESLKTTEPMVKEKQIQVIHNLPEELSKVHLYSDPAKLKQIFNNLISNAVKFTSKGGSITISGKILPDISPPSEASQKDTVPPDTSQPSTPLAVPVPGVEICIQDTGIGLAPRHVDKIFESFFQVESGISSKTPGTGLGLPLVKRLVELHNGRIWVSSDGLGKGSCICFTIPLARDEDPSTFVAVIGQEAEIQPEDQYK